MSDNIFKFSHEEVTRRFEAELRGARLLRHVGVGYGAPWQYVSPANYRSSQRGAFGTCKTVRA
jgi:hypothetical protein